MHPTEGKGLWARCGAWHAERVWSAQILVEAIVYKYLHDEAAVADTVWDILRELVQAADVEVRVMALEMVVNAALRAQLCVDTISGEPLDPDVLPRTQRGLRQQLLRMLEFACQEELLDAPMCEAAVSGVLLLCTRQGQVTAAVSSSTTPALEALAALATHCCSDDTVLHADGELVGVP